MSPSPVSCSLLDLLLDYLIICNDFLCLASDNINKWMVMLLLVTLSYLEIPDGIHHNVLVLIMHQIFKFIKCTSGRNQFGTKKKKKKPRC